MGNEKRTSTDRSERGQRFHILCQAAGIHEYRISFIKDESIIFFQDPPKLAGNRERFMRMRCEGGRK